MMEIIYTIFDWTPAIFWTTTGVDVLVLAPLAIWQSTRPLSAIGFMLSATILAPLAWLTCAVLVAFRWGTWALTVTIFTGCVPTVISAFVIMAMDGQWMHFLGLTLMVVVTLGAAVAATLLE